MAIREIVVATYVDDDMEHGFLRVRDIGREFSEVTMSPATYQEISARGSVSAMYDAIEELGPGLHPVPLAVLDTADVERMLAIAEPGDGSWCVMSGCLQDVVSTERGFPLCATHSEHLRDWDSLLA